MRFGAIVKDARRAARLTQDELGRVVGVTGQAVGQWENGTVRPSGANVQRLVEVLHLDPVALIEADVALALAAGLGPHRHTPHAPIGFPRLSRPHMPGR